MSTPIKPAIITVGDELIRAERSNNNMRWLLKKMVRHGCPCLVALTVGDHVERISAAIRHCLELECNPIVLSGGIGGTHDDKSREGVAQAMERPLECHPQCDALLRQRYRERSLPYTSQRQRMAQLPSGCSLIDNPFGAPGFICHPVYAFPGFPNMLHVMFASSVAPLLPKPIRMRIQTLRFLTSEGNIAEHVERFSEAHREASIGIYPSARLGTEEVKLVIRYPRHLADMEQHIESLRQRLELLSG